MADSLIEDLEIIKGDSSKVYLLGSKDVAEFDADWYASYTIRKDNVDGNVVVERALPKNLASGDIFADTKFVFQIYPTESALLTAGKYFLSVQLSNDTLPYRRELIQSKLLVLKEGVVAP
jgi:hypothetical protein